MKTYPVTLLDVGLLSGTRATAGLGLGLALGNYVAREKRGAVGWTLLGFGSVLYIVMVVNLIYRNRPPQPQVVP